MWSSRGQLKAIAAAAMLCAVPAWVAAQRPRCRQEAAPAPKRKVLYASAGSASGGHRRLNGALVAEGYAPLAENAVAGGFGFWMSPRESCGLLQVELNVLQWATRSAADGRRADVWAADIMIYGGAPVMTSGRTSVYPLFGLGVRTHFLEIAGAPPRESVGAPGQQGRMTVASALHRNGEWEAPAQLMGDIAVGAHHLLGTDSKRYGLAVGARMGYIVGPAYNRWIIAEDTIRGPMVNTSGPYGRLLVGVSFGRREGPRPLPARPPEPRVRGGRPTRRLG